MFLKKIVVVLMLLAFAQLAQAEIVRMKYFPVIITWYGDHVEKKTQVLPGFVKELCETSSECTAKALCEIKAKEVKHLLYSPDPQMGSIVVCVGREIKKPTPEKEKE